MGVECWINSLRSQATTVLQNSVLSSGLRSTGCWQKRLKKFLFSKIILKNPISIIFLQIIYHVLKTISYIYSSAYISNMINKSCIGTKVSCGTGWERGALCFSKEAGVCERAALQGSLNFSNWWVVRQLVGGGGGGGSCHWTRLLI